MSFKIIICPGAWPITSFFDPLKQAFESRKIRTECRVRSTYPPYDRTRPPTVNPDTEFFRDEILRPAVESGEDVVLFLYSYGAVYASESLQGLSKQERQAKGLKGGVIAVIYNAGFLASEGMMALTAMGMESDNLPEYIDYDYITGFAAINKDYAKAAYFNGVPWEMAEKMAAILPKQPAACFMTPTHYDPYHDPYFQGKLAFIYNGADRVFPIQGQRAAVKGVGITRTHLLENASHSPHMEYPEKLADIVLGLVEEITNGASDEE